MLPRKKRLGTKLLGVVLEKGKSYYSPTLSLRVYKTEFNPSRFAVSVSKKISKKAVTRNKIKRVLYSLIKESFRKEWPNGYMGLFSVKKTTILDDQKALFLEIGKLVKDAGLKQQDVQD